jgi:hypothetical protein
MRIGDEVVMCSDGLDAPAAALPGLGYETKGPLVRGRAVLPGSVRAVAGLPVGHGWWNAEAGSSGNGSRR